MTDNITKTPEIAPDKIESLIEDLTSENPQNRIKDLDGLTNFIVLKCLADNISNVPDIGNLIKGLKDTLAYEYFLNNRCNTEPTNNLIKVPIFTEESNKYVRFALKTETLNQEILTSASGFHVTLPESKKMYLQYYNEKRPEYKKLRELLIEGENILITGIPDVGKTRLVYEGLKSIKGHYAFSLRQIDTLNINKIEISEEFVSKGKKIIWFIDDIDYLFGFNDVLWRIYEKLVSQLESLTVIATARKDKKLLEKSQIIKYMKKLEVSMWKYKEAEDFVLEHQISISKEELRNQFANTPFSIYGDIDKMKDIYCEKISIKCKWVLRYLKLLHELMPTVERRLLEDVYTYLTENEYKRDTFETCLNNLKRTGFVEVNGTTVFSRYLYLKEIVTEEDYDGIAFDLVRLIIIFSKLDKVFELHLLANYLFNKHRFRQCIECNKHFISVCKRINYTHFLSTGHFNIGSALNELARLEHNADLFQEAYDNFELAVNNSGRFAELFYGWGNSILGLALTTTADDKRDLLNKAILKYKLATDIKVNFPEAYCNWGVVLNNLARLSKDVKLYNKAIKKFELAIKLKNELHEAYYAWGMALCDIADIQNNNKKREESLDKFRLAVQFNPEDHDVYYKWGNELSYLALIHKDENLFMDACSKYKSAVQYNNNFHDAYYNWGTAQIAFGEITNDPKLFEEAILNFSLAVMCKEDYSLAYYETGNALSHLAMIHNKKELYIDACMNYKLATTYMNNLYMAYHNWGVALANLAKLCKNKALYKKAISKLKLAIENKSDYFEAYYSWGRILTEYNARFKVKQNNREVRKLFLISYCHCILQEKLSSLNSIVNELMQIDDNDIMTILHVYGAALVTIDSHEELTKKEIKTLAEGKGLMKETDIVIESLLDKKMPKKTNVTADNLLLRTAIFIAKKIVDLQKKKK
jgi:tetratricopeptide (TPR) repeat protein